MTEEEKRRKIQIYIESQKTLNLDKLKVYFH